MTEHKPLILVADDDPEIRRLLARYIEGQDFRVLLAASCRELREQLAINPIDLVVLDVLLPDGSGLDTCRDLRAERNMVPIILLTALKEDIDRILGLEMGADDYLGKPFNPRELVARIRAVLRRRAEPMPPSPSAKRYQFEGFVADPRMRSLADAQGNSIELTGAEFDLLRLFLERPGRVLSRDQLLDLTHGRDDDVLDRSIDVLISRLRRKLNPSGTGRLFKTVRNGGYQLVVKVEVQDLPS
ncbi:MAG: response regulator transcription factor [Rhizobiales bacterium]|nr:response regulator transcription factor [Hyphomicrobiales bacterium]